MSEGEIFTHPTLDHTLATPPRPSHSDEKRQSDTCVFGCSKWVWEWVGPEEIPLCLSHYKTCHLLPSTTVQVVLQAKGYEVQERRPGRCADCGSDEYPFALILPSIEGVNFKTLLYRCKYDEAMEYIPYLALRCGQCVGPWIRKLFSDAWPFPVDFGSRWETLYFPDFMLEELRERDERPKVAQKVLDTFIDGEVSV